MRKAIVSYLAPRITLSLASYLMVYVVLLPLPAHARCAVGQWCKAGKGTKSQTLVVHVMPLDGDGRFRRGTQRFTYEGKPEYSNLIFDCWYKKLKHDVAPGTTDMIGQRLDQWEKIFPGSVGDDAAKVVCRY